MRRWDLLVQGKIARYGYTEDDGGDLEAGGALSGIEQDVEAPQQGLAIDLEDDEPGDEDYSIQNEHEARVLVICVGARKAEIQREKLFCKQYKTKA